MYSLIRGILRADNTSASDSQSIITVLVTRATYEVRLSNEVFDQILSYMLKCFSSLRKSAQEFCRLNPSSGKEDKNYLSGA